jgi:hypothetical protein
MVKMKRRRSVVVGAVIAIAIVGLVPSAAMGSHSWNGYHWARTSNPFTLRLGDNVSAVWDGHLATTSSDWSKSTVLNTRIASSNRNPRSCRPTSGRVEVCSATYGNTGWLGVAQIWLTGGTHIRQGTVKVNDTYFRTGTYSSSAWRNLVMCQEVGHTLGLDHQDEDFDNPNLGTCMDYTSNPTSNQHPNAHDYAELEEIYEHVDSFTSVGSAARAGSRGALTNASGWGRAAERPSGGRPTIYVRDLGRGNVLVTFVTWA